MMLAFCAISINFQVPLIRAFGHLKQACAIVNMKYGLDKTVGDTIVKATDEVIDYWTVGVKMGILCHKIFVVQFKCTILP